jgi:hypothetical protein
MSRSSYQWWKDPKYIPRLAAEGEVMQRFFPDAIWVINDEGRFAARLAVKGRRIVYLCEAEYPDNFPYGTLLGRILEPDISRLDTFKDHVLPPNTICVHHRELGGAVTSGVVVLRTAIEWIRRFGEKRFG